MHTDRARPPGRWARRVGKEKPVWALTFHREAFDGSENIAILPHLSIPLRHVSRPVLGAEVSPLRCFRERRGLSIDDVLAHTPAAQRDRRRWALECCEAGMLDPRCGYLTAIWLAVDQMGGAEVRRLQLDWFRQQQQEAA